jgi:trk system potassium uptake protein TrkH
MRPAKWIFTGYLCIILVGCLLLSLPVSSSGERISAVDSLFTATSSLCVTGLIVKDTPNDFSLFGHIVILTLIQLGGLGYMTIGSLLFLILGRRLSIRQSTVVSEGVSLMDRGNLRLLIKKIVLFTAIFEVSGMLIFTHSFAVRHYTHPLWLGLFHSVSAFCNAGFSLFSDSFIRFQNDSLFLLTAFSLFIIGGLGFVVLAELVTKRKKKLSLHSRIVLVTTLILIVTGSFLFFFLEDGNLLKNQPIGTRILLSYFQAATPRTAGFTALNMGGANNCTLFFILILMFIGASPGGTGGGIKTTTFSICFLSTLQYLEGKRNVNAFRKRIREEDIRRAFYIVVVSLALISFGVLVLSLEGLPFERVLFEELSAFGTVGLSTGSLSISGVSLSHDFSIVGKLMIIITMFAGRIGPLTLGFAFLERKELAIYKYPEELVQVG